MNKPVLSVAIIFKNEIRCLERCLRSMQPLRERIATEIVMADTGSDDGSRAVAEKYADVVFDFPWINDFAAARNAVLERCSGEWALVVDADEWLDDGAELAAYVSKPRPREKSAALTIRNYSNAALTEYSDFIGQRVLNLRVCPRYEGAIHEKVVFPDGSVPAKLLSHTLLRHDGYVDMYKSERGEEKRRRNMELLHAELERNPDDLRTLMQAIESGYEDPACSEWIERAVQLIKEQADEQTDDWKAFGAPLLRQAIVYTGRERVSEEKRAEWSALAEGMFPDSIFTRVDVNFFLGEVSLNRGDYADAIRRLKEYFAGCAEADRGAIETPELSHGTLMSSSEGNRSAARLMLARAYANLGDKASAEENIDAAELERVTARRVYLAMNALLALYTKTDADTALRLRRLWAGVNAEDDEKKERADAFAGLAAALLRGADGEDPARPLWRMLLPLAGECVFGDAAAMLDTEDAGELSALLARQEELSALPERALWHALEHGAAFPPTDRPLRMEEADALAMKLAARPEKLRELACRCARETPEDAPLAALDWARALTMAAARGWEGGEDDLALPRAFVAVERACLPRLYTAEALDMPALLPPMHRAGACLAKAFDALDAGDAAGALRAARESVSLCPESRGMAEALMREVERRAKEKTAQDAPPELLALAAQVKALLANYPADDPAVAELKKSPAYQKVAYLIEA